jgi:Ca2+-binding EF-hand superfamily protein
MADGYMEKRDYDVLQTAADWLNNCESDLNELRARFGALYPDNSYSINQADFEEAITAFEQSQRELIKAMDALIP